MSVGYELGVGEIFTKNLTNILPTSTYPMNIVLACGPFDYYYFFFFFVPFPGGPNGLGKALQIDLQRGST